MERCSLLSLPRYAVGRDKLPATQKSAQSHALAAAAVVMPTLSCRRCESSPEFASAADLRTHFRLHHTRAAPAEDATSDGSTDSSAGDDDARDRSGESEASIAEGAHGDDMTDGDDKCRAVSGPLVPVRFSDAGTGPVWVYRALLLSSRNKAVAEAAADLRGGAAASPLELPLADIVAPGETWAVFAFSSGYFMSSIWEVAPPPPGSPAAGVGAPGQAPGHARMTWPRLLMHKRHHRYTTRRKQGGSQSAHDAKGHLAKSVGAQMRRAGERHLLEDVHGIFTHAEWAPAIRRAARVVLAAPRRERPAFLAAAAPTLERRDPRVFSPPFETGRPSLDVVTSIVRTLLLAAVPPPPGDAPAAGGSEPVAGPRASARGAPQMQTARGASPPLIAVVGEGAPTAEVASGADAVGATGAGEDASDGAESAGGVVAVVRQPQFAPGKRRNQKKGKAAPAARAASPTALASSEDALQAALMAAVDDARIRDARAGGAELLRAARAAAETAVDEAAARTLVPRAALASALALDARTAPLPPAAAGRPADDGEAVGRELQRLSAVCERVSTILALTGAGATPSQAFSAVGLDGLAAAALVASSLTFVDWSQFAVAPQGATRSAEEDELSAAVGRKKAPRTGGPRRH